MKNQSLMVYSDFIKKSEIPTQFFDQLLNEKFINNTPQYYQNYPELFSNLYKIDKVQLDLLNIAGFLYYQATIHADSLMDEKDVAKFPLISICQEESIKILTSIYGLNNDFWKLWNIRKSEYFIAILLDKELSKKEIITINEYEILADKKSAFGKIAIDCLYSIDNSNKELYNNLLLSHKYFSVAFQLNDDIQDFREDLKNDQFNWAVYLLQKEGISNQDPIILEKYLYIRNISKEIYLLAIEYCDKSLLIIDDFDLPKWEFVINSTKKTFLSAILEIDNYMETLLTQIEKS